MRLGGAGELLTTVTSALPHLAEEVLGPAGTEGWRGRFWTWLTRLPRNEGVRGVGDGVGPCTPALLVSLEHADPRTSTIPEQAMGSTEHPVASPWGLWSVRQGAGVQAVGDSCAPPVDSGPTL